MLGIGYFKAEPSEYVRISVNGSIRKEGVGVSGFFFPHRTSIELVETTTREQPFAFNEVTKDNQQISLQGGFLYRVAEPGKMFGRYNFAVEPHSKNYLSEDPMKLPEHLVQIIRANSRRIVQTSKLEPLLVMGEELSDKVTAGISGLKVIPDLGLELNLIYFSSIIAPPEIAKALGAEYRENLLQRADQAVYSRRAQAVEQERAILENELKNKIELEQRREQLVKLNGKNVMEEARTKAEAAKLEMAVFEGMGADKLRAHALYEIGRNAQRISTLTITPELLAGFSSRT